MTIKECMDEFINYVTSYSASATVEYYDNNLFFFRTYLETLKISLDSDVNMITKTVYIGYMGYHKRRGVKNTSVRTYARAIKVFLRWCCNEGYLLENVTYNAKFPKPDKKLIVPLTNERVRALEKHMRRSYLWKRNICIFHLMLDCGLRRSEVIGLDIDDIHFEDGYISVNNSKNNKSRVVPLPECVAEDIECYLHSCVLSKHHKGKGALILDKDYKQRVTKYSIDRMFSRLKACDNDIHPHLLRHTFGTSFILGGGSLEVLRVLMGHEDYNVTREYLHIASQSQIVNLDIYKLDDVFFRVYNYRKG